MDMLKISDVTEYVEKHIGMFHERKLNNLKKLKLKTILKRKNPYLFKAKNIMTAQDLVKSLLDAHLSSQEEAIFGEFLEGLAIFINEKVYGGYKSSAEGIDLEFKKDDVHYIITIKSGPNWGNSSQIKKMLDNFRRAKRVLGTSIDKTKIAAINGCCYGIDNSPEKEEYSKLCGQRFWEFISGDGELYTKIIKPIGHQAKERNSKFMEKYTQIINIFTFEFGKEFCKEGIIEWKKLVDFNSGKSK